MKKLFLTLMLAVLSLVGMAQTIGEAFYIYRNDGQFNAFFRDEVDSIAYSNFDADSVFYDEVVTQVVYTQDSIYRIPLAVVDSVGFVTPENIVNSAVFPLTAEHSPYITDADTLNFSMAIGTPDNLLPAVGNIVVATADCEAFPDGIIAKVESRERSGNVYRFVCSLASIDDVFDQLVVYSKQTETKQAADESRAFDLRKASLSSELWNRNWTKTISGGGTTTTLNVGDRATVVVTARKTLTTPFFFQLQLQNTLSSSIDFNAKSSVGYWQEVQIGNTISAGKITVPYTAGLLWFTPKLSLFGYFEEEGKVELNYSGHFNRTDKVAFTYTKGQWSFNHAPSTDVGTDVASLSMEGHAEIGLRPQIDFSLNGRRAGFGMSAKVGLKEYINFTLDLTKLSDGGLYDAMRDSYCRTTIPWSLTAHASADVFMKYDSHTTDVGFATASYTFEPKTEPRWGEDRYIFPLFSNLEANRNKEQETTATAKAQVSRTPLLPVELGFSLLDKDKNIIKTEYDSRTYKDGNLFSSYNVELTGLKASEDYVVRPSVKLMGYDVLASPEIEVKQTEMPVEITEFKQTGSHYSKDGYSHEGKTYSYQYDCSVTVSLKNSENVEDWGYVYEDPNGRQARISLKNFNSPYTDSRYVYYRNASSSVVRLYEFVKYKDDAEYHYGEAKDYEVSHAETTCPDSNHPHMIDLGLPSGTKWACCNVGAHAPEEYGNYYAWGETQPKSVYNSDTYAYYNNSTGWVNIGSDIAGTQYDAATANWGAPWRMPSLEQCKELINNCSSEWTAQNGVKGRKFTGPNGGTVFLPAAGNRWYGELDGAGSDGGYWSSTLYESYQYYAYYLYFGSGNASWGIDYRYCGRSVRPVR
jgi:hypothetical protein